MNRCKTCRHWAPEAQDDVSSLIGAGECHKAPMIWTVTDEIEDDDAFRRRLKPEHAGVLAMVEDGSHYRARLVTMPDFGCVQHEAGQQEKRG